MKKNLKFKIRVFILALCIPFSFLNSSANAANSTNFSFNCSYAFSSGKLIVNPIGVPSGTYAVQYDLYLTNIRAASYLSYLKAKYELNVSDIGSGYQQGDVKIIAYPIYRNDIQNKHFKPFIEENICTNDYVL